MLDEAPKPALWFDGLTSRVAEGNLDAEGQERDPSLRVTDWTY
jgi:hypothetical protein